jgi:hypothetical protein
MILETFRAQLNAAWKRAVTACCLMAVAGTASALPFPNPDPGALLDDLDDTGYYMPWVTGSLALELFDLGDSVASFGFFAKGDPGTRLPIFEAADLVGEAAIIDFSVGYVFDVEDNAIQSLFPGVPTIGFYLDFAGNILYSDPNLNIGGVDVMATFESIDNGFLNLLFFDGAADNPSRSLLSWHAITEVAPVPVPATWLLMMLGLGLLATRRAKKSYAR